MSNTERPEVKQERTVRELKRKITPGQKRLQDNHIKDLGEKKGVGVESDLSTTFVRKFTRWVRTLKC